MPEPKDAHPTATLLAEALATARADEGRYGDAHWAALKAVHVRGDRQALATALAWSRSDDAVERVLAADLLGQLGAAGDGPSPFAGESAPALRSLVHDTSPRVAAAAVQALAQLGAADAGLLDALAAHPAAEVRHAAAQALGGRGDAASLAVLVRLMGDLDDTVRSWATFAVASTDADTAAVRDALAARLDDRDPDARGEAMIGLARRGDDRAAAAIVRELSADEPMPLAVDAGELFVAACPARADVVAALEAWRTANRRTLPWLQPPPRR